MVSTPAILTEVLGLGGYLILVYMPLLVIHCGITRDLMETYCQNSRTEVVEE